MMFPGVEELMTRYRSRAAAADADALGYYITPQAYAQMQVVEEAVMATRTLDDAVLAEYTHSATFSTVVGEVRFGKGGEWAAPRVLQVQFKGIRRNDIGEFKTARTRTVISPKELASGELVPFAQAATLP